MSHHRTDTGSVKCSAYQRENSDCNSAAIAALDDCGHLKPAVEAYVKRSFSESYLREHPVNRREIADAIGHGHTYSLEALWSCGADKIAEAEKLLSK